MSNERKSRTNMARSFTMEKGASAATKKPIVEKLERHQVAAIDGNVLQKGHATTQAMFLLLGVAGNLGVIGEKKYAGFALEKVPDLGKKTLGARVVTNPMFIIPLNLWQTAHGAGVFGSA